MVRYLFYTIGDLTYQSPLVQQWRTASSSFIIRQRWLSGVVKSGLSGDQDIGEGDVAEPRPIHWPGSASFRNSCTVSYFAWRCLLRTLLKLWNHLIYRLTCAVSYAPKYWLPSDPQWNNCLYATVNFSKQTSNEKMRQWVLSHHGLSHVHCHTGSPSQVFHNYYSC